MASKWIPKDFQWLPKAYRSCLLYTSRHDYCPCIGKNWPQPTKGTCNFRLCHSAYLYCQLHSVSHLRTGTDFGCYPLSVMGSCGIGDRLYSANQDQRRLSQAYFWYPDDLGSLPDVNPMSWLWSALAGTLSLIHICTRYAARSAETVGSRPTI